MSKIANAKFPETRIDFRPKEFKAYIAPNVAAN